MPERTASLPMYDFSFLVDDTDQWWQGLARQFREAGIAGVPDRLARPGAGADFWLCKDLLISQTCGYPLVTWLAGATKLLGTPCYDMDGCEGSDYRSFIIVRKDFPASDIADLRGARCVISGTHSWSGHHALRLVSEPLVDGGRPAFEASVSGGHPQSIDAVVSGDADFATVDCVSFGMLSRYEPERTAGLRILERTPPLPGLPLIVGGGVPDSEITLMRDGLRAALDDPALAECRGKIAIRDIRFTDEREYQRMSDALAELEAAGIPMFV